MKRIWNVMKTLLLSLVIVAGLWGVSTLDARAEESGTTRNYADLKKGDVIHAGETIVFPEIPAGWQAQGVMWNRLQFLYQKLVIDPESYDWYMNYISDWEYKDGGEYYDPETKDGSSFTYPIREIVCNGVAYNTFEVTAVYGAGHTDVSCDYYYVWGLEVKPLEEGSYSYKYNIQELNLYIGKPVVGETLATDCYAYERALKSHDYPIQWTKDGVDVTGQAAEADSNYTATVTLIPNGNYRFYDSAVIRMNRAENSYSAISLDNNGYLTLSYQFTTSVQKEDSSYAIVDGADSTYEEVNGGTLTIRGDGEISKFVSVMVDGEVIDSSNYTVTEGSTIVTLTAEYLKTLSAGSHTFAIQWTDGAANTAFTIVKNNNPGSSEPESGNEDEEDTPAAEPVNATPAPTAEPVVTVPKTGDNSSVALWITTLVLAAGAFAVVTGKQKAEKK